MTTIGKYKVEAEIGRGGFGRVYRAFDPTVGRRVAIKVVLSDRNEDLLARFRKEATATGKLQHKNIVTVYEYGVHENSPYLVMEYLEGEDLKTAIQENHITSLLEVSSIIGQVAEGLQHAHHNGIVHRDIKPANIMILSDGTAKIMDFGIARVLNEFTTRLTRHGDVLGTLAYMAPELFQGAEIDERCDIFSLGAIAYQLVTGKQPFEADEPARIIYNITAAEAPRVSAIVPDCPPAVEQLISRAMHRDRELRYQSVEDLLFDLMPIRLQLQSAEAQNLIKKANLLIQAKQIRDAQPLVKQVLQLDPHNTAARELRERINRELQQQTVRDRSEQMIASGTEFLNGLQYDKAMEVFQSALSIDPSNTNAQNLLDQVKTAIRKRERADALIGQARRELASEQFTDAYRSILECLQLAPDHKDGGALLETIRAAIKTRERQRRLTEGLSKVSELLTADKPEEAEGLLSDLETSYPASPKIKELAAEVALSIERKNKARRLLQDLDKARTLLSGRKWSEALVLLNRLRGEFPDSEEVLSLTTFADEQLQLQKKAEHIERILQDAGTANEGRDFERAINLLNEGLRAYPGEASLTAMLARTENLRTDYQRKIAIRAAKERAVDLATNNDFAAALSVIDLTIATWESSELQELRTQIHDKYEAFKRKQAIAGSCTSVREKLERGMYEEAITVAEEALDEFPGEPELTSLLGAAKKRLEEQRRQARLKTIRDDATTRAADDRFSEALDLLQTAMRDLGNEPSLTTLFTQIQSQQKEYERRKAVAAAATSLRELIKAKKYAEAVSAGSAALSKFPGESKLVELVESAQQALTQEKRAQQIANTEEKVKTFVAAKDFQAALRLIRSTIQDVGSTRSLEKLAQSVEASQLEQEKQEAIRAAAVGAKAMLERKDYANAIELLENTLQKYRGEESLAKLLSVAREQLAIKQRSEAVENILRKADEQRAAQQLHTALRLVQAGIKEYPDESRLTAAAAEVRALILEVEKERAIRAALDSAAKLRDEGDFSKAAQLLEQALLKAPGHADLVRELNRVKEKVSAQQKVNVVLDEVCELMSRERFDEALARVKSALVSFPGELALSSLLEEVKTAQRSSAVTEACQEIETHYSSGEFAKASRLANEALAAFPREPAIVALKQRIESKVAEKKRHDDTIALTAEIRQLLDEHRVDAAMGKLTKALREYPDEPELTTLHQYTNEIVAERDRADAISELAKKSKALLQKGKPREAVALLEDALRKYPDEESFSILLQRARAEAASRREPEKPATVSPPRNIVPAPVPQPAPKPEPAATPRRSMAMYAAVIVAVVVIAIVVWALYPRETGNRDQELLDSARSSFAQKDFPKAVETTQQIPASSPLYQQAQELLTQVRAAERQTRIDGLLGDAERLHREGKDEESLTTIKQVIDLDASNSRALGLRNEVERTIFNKKAGDEQDRYVRTTLDNARQLLAAGKPDEAKAKVDEVLRARENDRDAITLRSRIQNQLDVESRMQQAQTNWEQAKRAAETAQASEFDPAKMAQARRAEQDAQGQLKQRQFDRATKSFGDSAALYREAADKATSDRRNRAAAEEQQQRTQAQTAKDNFERNRNGARGDAERQPAYQNAVKTAQDAQARFDRGDYVGARGQFDAASADVAQALRDAGNANQAAQQALIAQQRRDMEAAHTDMDNAKRGIPANDPRASQAVAAEARARQHSDAGRLTEATEAYKTAAGLWVAVGRAIEADRAADAAERQAIRRVLANYKTAYDTKNINSLRALVPEVNRDLENMFRQATSLQLRLDEGDITITGDSAAVPAQRQIIATFPGNNRNEGSVDRVRFNLRKRNGSWVIESIQLSN